MSYASDALLKDTASKVSQLEKMVAALKYKVDTLEQQVSQPAVYRQNRKQVEA